ncbi:MAG: MBL fold hydrolase, partial [Deltaproteobacteria bacterium]
MHDPVRLTSHLYQLGTYQFPAYLSIGEIGMLIEGGTGPTTQIIVEQIKKLGFPVEKIQYIALTHTHADHIGSIPRFKNMWPWIKIIGSVKGAEILKNNGILKEFLWIDKNIAELMKKRNEIDKVPEPLQEYDFTVNIIVKEGDKIELGDGIVWHVYEAPGHSPCHLAYYEEKEGSLIIGDATGFYVPEKDVFWPNYFDSLNAYLDSIKKLSELKANIGALS